MFRTLALLSLAIAPLLACTTDGQPDTAATRAAEGPLVGRTISLTIPDAAFDRAMVDALAKHIEAAVGAESLSVRVEKADDGGAAQLTIDAWGRTAIGDDALVAGLRRSFPAVASGPIAISAAADAPAPESLPALEVDGDEDPEVVRQRVMEQLRAKGVQGDVQVTVEDDGDEEEGRREIRVEVKDDKHVGAH
ncbi:MAG: hypothetical protein K1X88_25470 [Nannocystaceae bacterium]|nr:hypothetical protein [Nannocystaceae bacterium]